MKASKTLKWLLPIVVSLAVGAFGGYQYFNTTVPHTQFGEIKDKLAVVERRLAQAETSPGDQRQQAAVRKAKALFSEAERAWIGEDYGKAEEFLVEAHSLIPVVLQPPPPPSPAPPWGLIQVIVVVVLVAAALAYYRTKAAKPGP